MGNLGLMMLQRVRNLMNTLALKVYRKNPDRYMARLYRQQLRRLDHIIRFGENPFKEPEWSLRHYEEYDGRELRDLETKGWISLVDGELRWISARELRRRYVDVICKEIDATLEAGVDPSVLEVGCGNCVNLIELKKRYGDKLSLSGFDISPRRLEIAREYHKDALNEIDLRVASVADPSLPASYGRKFGIVFSMHCLEQIPNLVGPALDNMLALSSGRVVMIEPDWELSHPAQRVYLIISDHMRTLLRTVRARGLNLVKAEQLKTLSSLKNPSSLIVVQV